MPWPRPARPLRPSHLHLDRRCSGRSWRGHRLVRRLARRAREHSVRREQGAVGLTDRRFVGLEVPVPDGLAAGLPPAHPGAVEGDAVLAHSADELGAADVAGGPLENSRQVASSQASRLVLSILAESRGYGSIGSRCGRPR